MAEDEDISLNAKGLDEFIRVFKNNIPTVRVGILGESNVRSVQVQGNDGKFSTWNSSNATIGAVHEFGTSKVPKRSFLRAPLTEKLNKELERAGAFNDDVLKRVLKEGDATAWMEKVAVVAEAVVLGAFTSNGYGKWKAHAPGYTNNTGQILDDTGQLKRSIKSEVKK